MNSRWPLRCCSDRRGGAELALLEPPLLDFEVVLDHHRHERFEIDLRFPAEDALRLCRIADEEVDLRRPEEAFVNPHIAFPVLDARDGEGELDEFSDSAVCPVATT